MTLPTPREAAETLAEQLPLIKPTPLQSGQTITMTVTYQSYSDPVDAIEAALTAAERRGYDLAIAKLRNVGPTTGYPAEWADWLDANRSKERK